MADRVDMSGNNHTDGAPIRVGVAGLGRSGWHIHVETIAQLPQRFELVAVADACPHRRTEAEAKLRCRAYADVDRLLSHAGVELIVIATPSHLHAEQAIAAMEAGRHVLCEKPMAVSAQETDAMIAASERTGCILTAFHNRRFDPHFLKVREVVDSGELGRIIQVRLAVHNFVRRWDWQTLREFGGGTLNNTGPHFLDQVLSFLGDEPPEVFCHTDRALALGDAEDHCVVMLRTSSGPLVQLELTSACALPQDNWLIMGTRGALRGSFHRLTWRIADFSHLPEPRLERGPAPGRAYPGETPNWYDRTWEVPPEQEGRSWTYRRFYERLYASLRHGDPLPVTPDHVQRLMRVLDACHAQADAWRQVSWSWSDDPVRRPLATRSLSRPRSAT